MIEAIPSNATSTPRAIVLDTNVALDLLLFADPATEPLRHALHSGLLRWLATQRMRDELWRVLRYTHIERLLAVRLRDADAILASFDGLTTLVPIAPRAPWVCTDTDDQMFIDLAVAHQCDLVSKDKAVLKLRKRLLRSGCRVSPVWAE
jgi:putative PIN family toxin of toxin-antitoxin system